MEILQVLPDMQGVRVQGAGGLALVNEDWMCQKYLNSPASLWYHESHSHILLT